MRPRIVAIDGTAGSGKSTVARLLARELGLGHIDTGATYRLVALHALERGADLDDEEHVAALATEVLAGCDAAPSGALRCEGREVGEEIRTSEVSHAASVIAAHPPVRKVLVEFQRRLVPPGGAVVEGRDIGTVVWPDAELKVFLDAREAVRAQRRFSDAGERGALEAVRARDARDRTRPVGAMQPAPDAMVLDTSERTPEQLVTVIHDRLGTTPTARPNLLYRIVWRIVRALARGVFRLEVQGAERIPVRGPVILAPNHRALLDIPISAVLTRRKVWFMAKDELYRFKPLAAVFTRLGGFPVRRGKPDRQAIRRSLDLLAQGEILGIFPEGTRTPDARFDRLEEGFAYLALRSGAPIVPVALSGTEQVLPRDRKLPRFVKLRALVGEPFTLGGPVDGMLPRSRVRTATTEAQRRLQAAMDELDRP